MDFPFIWDTIVLIFFSEKPLFAHTAKNKSQVTILTVFNTWPCITTKTSSCTAEQEMLEKSHIVSLQLHFQIGDFFFFLKKCQLIVSDRAVTQFRRYSNHCMLVHNWTTVPLFLHIWSAFKKINHFLPTNLFLSCSAM